MKAPKWCIGLIGEFLTIVVDHFLQVKLMEIETLKKLKNLVDQDIS